MSTEPNEDTERSDNDTPCNEPQEQDTATEKRYRRKSVRRQLQDVVTKLGKVAEDSHQKPAKKVDALLRQSEVLLRLQEMDAEEKRESVIQENTRLSQLCEELKSENAALREAKNDGVQDFLKQLSGEAHADSVKSSDILKVDCGTTSTEWKTSSKTDCAAPRSIDDVREELIQRERRENLDRQATMTLAWRSQMGLV
jgi:hypothetical protein